MTDPTSDMIIEAQELGHKAYREGVSGRGNPYRMSTDETLCTAWIRGFNMARTDRAIFPEHPVGAFIASVPGGLGGLRKISEGRWEMIGPDGSPTEKLVSDDFARMLFDAAGTELDLPASEA